MPEQTFTLNCLLLSDENKLSNIEIVSEEWVIELRSRLGAALEISRHQTHLLAIWKVSRSPNTLQLPFYLPEDQLHKGIALQTLTSIDPTFFQDLPKVAKSLRMTEQISVEYCKESFKEGDLHLVVHLIEPPCRSFVSYYLPFRQLIALLVLRLGYVFRDEPQFGGVLEVKPDDIVAWVRRLLQDAHYDRIPDLSDLVIWKVGSCRTVTR